MAVMQYMPLKTKQNQPALNFNQANLWDKMRQHDWLRFHNVQIYVFNKVLVSIMQQNLDKCFFLYLLIFGSVTSRTDTVHGQIDGSDSLNGGSTFISRAGSV